MRCYSDKKVDEMRSTEMNGQALDCVRGITRRTSKRSACDRKPDHVEGTRQVHRAGEDSQTDNTWILREHGVLILL